MTKIQTWKNTTSKEAKLAKNWIEDFLCKSNKNLGREGPVCPYTQTAIHQDTIYFCEHSGTLLNKKKLINLLRTQLPTFNLLEGKKTYKVLINLFPSINKGQYQVIEEIQKELKSEFVENKLMLGQFYSGCDEGGLYNPDFKPLDSPIPMLAIRHIALTDVAFLHNSKNQLETYLQIFGEKGHLHLNKIRT